MDASYQELLGDKTHKVTQGQYTTIYDEKDIKLLQALVATADQKMEHRHNLVKGSGRTGTL